MFGWEVKASEEITGGKGPSFEAIHEDREGAAILMFTVKEQQQQQQQH